MDALTFRRLLGRFATGVTVVTTGTPEQPHGMTANAFCSVSLDPPLVLVCVGKNRYSHDLIRRCGRFGVSVLAESQRWLSELFASPVKVGVEGAQGLFEAGASGLPLIPGALVHLECRLEAVYPGGDHSIFLGLVEQGRLGPEGPPLVFFESGYRRLARE